MKEKRKKGFTLIELLVVVLIIGILSAVALPQYQKAVAKSQNAQALTLLTSVYRAQKLHHMSTGEYARNFDELDIDIPWTENTAWNPNYSTAARSNKDWSLQMYTGPMSMPYQYISIGRISGPYKGTGFFIYLYTSSFSDKFINAMLCYENTLGKYNSVKYDGTLGSWCPNIIGSKSSSKAASDWGTLYHWYML